MKKFDDSLLACVIDLTVREPTLPVAPATKMTFPSFSPVFISAGCKSIVVAPNKNEKISIIEPYSKIYILSAIRIHFINSFDSKIRVT